MRAEHSRRAVFAKQWITHVSCCDNARKIEGLLSLDSLKLNKIDNLFDFLSPVIKKPKPKCTGHSKSAVVRCAAAEPDATEPQWKVTVTKGATRRIENHFTDSERVRAKWIAFTFRKPPHSRGFVHFHHCELALLDRAIARVDFAADRIVRRTIHPGTTERVTNNFGRPFPAVRHRYDVDRRLRQDVTKTFRDVFRNFPRAERAFEFIGSD